MLNASATYGVLANNTIIMADFYLWLVNTKPDGGPRNWMNEITCQMDGFQTDKEWKSCQTIR